MRGKFGPNSAQVERFLAKVRSLTSADWERIRALERLAKSAYGWTDWEYIEITAYRSLGQRDAERLLKDIGKHASAIKGEGDEHAVTTAAMCLALAGEIPDSKVSAAYGEFSEVIPVATLGPGRAPTVDPPPKTPWGRFVTRACLLEDPERYQIIKVAYSVESAVGVDGIDSALKATNNADPEFFLPGWAEIERSVNARIDRHIRLNEWMGAIGAESFTEERNARDRAAGDAFTLCAGRALDAVMSRGRMPAKEFSILYTPFAGLIPIESLFGNEDET